MPEEINRVATDAIADLLLTSCRDADANLLREGIAPERIRFVGNVMIDSLVHLLPRAAESRILDTLGVAEGRYVAVTLHRPSNVDDPRRLKLILGQLQDLADDQPVVFPMHPRTRKTLEASGVARDAAGVRMIDPLGYHDFLRLQSRAALVVTDSGGVQEETTYLGIPCLTVRPNTERPVTITEGTNRLVDPEVESLVHLAREALADPRRKPVIEGWDGHAAERICRILESSL